jgi:anthranilate synthase/aminodeoxychorismate synthase-like glutamine amidotransferase
MPHRLLLIDNYDSFTYNLVHYFKILGAEVTVVRHDEITVAEVKSFHPTALVLSPGPGNPSQAGISLGVIETYYKDYPLLGVCLGHQCLAQVFGATITRANTILHGKTSDIYHHREGLFKQLPRPFKATRYHSLAVDPATLSNELVVTAWTQDAAGNRDTIMSLQHRDYPLFGVQFHPEAILTEQGLALLKNFLDF